MNNTPTQPPSTSDIEIDSLLDSNIESDRKAEPTNFGFSNSPMIAVEVQPLLPAPLANRKPPQYERQQEQPHHRIIVELAGKGFTAVEIAAQTGFSPTMVQDILRQGHSQKPLLDAIQKNFGTDQEVVEVIKGAVVKAVKRVERILDDKNASNRDAIAAANLLLERRYGKANQPINRGSDVDLNKLPDSELLKMVQNQ